MYNKKKLIIGITGIRSEYDIMSSVYEEINKRESLDLKLIVTGAHLSKKYGETINEIKKDGYEIISIINSLQEENNLGSRVVGLGIQLQKIAIDLNNLQPDFLIVLGDREESMTAGLLAAYMNIPLIHIGGGDRVIGNVDDQVRHAVTKLAHIHCVTNEESKKRVLRLGEQPFRVFNFGNPGLDRIVKTPNVRLNEIQELENFINYENEPYILLIQHAISSETEKSKLQMKITLEAVKEMKIKTFKSGDRAFDWKIPLEWNVNDAYIMTPNGKKICEYSKNKLHLVGYSVPTNKILSKKKLLKKLHTLPNLKNAIPYVTSYYKKDWGFCVNSSQYNKIRSSKGPYRIKIKSNFKKGSMSIGELLIKGKSKKEILISTYICHPSMANNELSGPVLLSALLKYVKDTFVKPKYSYRFILVPETIGSLAYMSRNLNQMQEKVTGRYIIIN